MAENTINLQPLNLENGWFVIFTYPYYDHRNTDRFAEMNIRHNDGRQHSIYFDSLHGLMRLITALGMCDIGLTLLYPNRDQQTLVAITCTQSQGYMIDVWLDPRNGQGWPPQGWEASFEMELTWGNLYLWQHRLDYIYASQREALAADRREQAEEPEAK